MAQKQKGQQRKPKPWVDKEGLKTRVREWADKIGVEIKELHLRDMKNKWASCSTAGRVTFNTELLTQNPRFCDYVIVHDLLHLRVPNHGKLFKALMDSYLPEWEEFANDGCEFD